MQLPCNAIEIKGHFTWMGLNGIARACIKPYIDITIKHVIENTAVVASFFKGVKFPILIHSKGIKSISYEARHHFSVRERDTKTNAFCIIIGSSISRVLGNFYLGINKPTVHTKLFDNEVDAIK